MGPALCLLSAACFAAMPIFGKLAYDAGVSPEALLLVRFGLAAALLGMLLLVRPSLRRAQPDSRQGESSSQPATTRARVLATAIGLGAIGYATQATLFFSALRLMDASLLSLIFYTYPVLVTVTAVLLGRDRLTRGRGAALLAASLGTLLVLLGAGGVSCQPLGALLAFAAALTYTGYILVADTVVRRLAPVLLSTLVMTGAAGTLGIRALFTGGVNLAFGAPGWFWLACIAVVSTVVAVLTFFAGLERTGPSTAAVLSTFEPVVTTALAALALGESLAPVQLAGGALVLASVTLLQVRPRRTHRQDQNPHQTSDPTRTRIPAQTGVLTQTGIPARPQTGPTPSMRAAMHPLRAGLNGESGSAAELSRNLSQNQGMQVLDLRRVQRPGKVSSTRAGTHEAPSSSTPRFTPESTHEQEYHAHPSSTNH